MSNSHIKLIKFDSSALEDEDKENRSPMTIKEEAISNDDVLLFTPAELEAFSGNDNNFPIMERIVNSDNIDNENTTFNIQSFDDNQLNQILDTDTLNKYSLDVNQMLKFEDIKNDQTGHLVKFKMQDGKHTKIWECSICSKEFGHQYTLMRHLPTHTDERKFQCNTCGKAFRQMSTLSQHRAIHSADRPYICEICHKTFNRVSTLISHRKTHTGQKPHCCHLCNKAFHQKGNLRNHIFTHTNERPYKCDVCTKGFNQMSNLMCHKLKAHQRADKPRYFCQTCGKDFQKRMALRNHEQHQHGVQNGIPCTSTSAPTHIKYTSGVLVDPINTVAMHHALSTNQIPFALLRPINGIPVLVRILPAGEKQMLVPATAEDLKKHGQITITPQVEENDKKVLENDAQNQTKPLGSTVLIRIPVVATVVQRCGKDGNMCMAIQSPPGSNNDDQQSETSSGVQTGNTIRYVDEGGNLLQESTFTPTLLSNAAGNNETQFATQNATFSTTVIQDDTHSQTLLQQLETGNIKMNCIDPNESIFEILEKTPGEDLNGDVDVGEPTGVPYDTDIDNEFIFP